MTPTEWVALSAGLIAVVGAIYSGVRFLVKSIMRELLPNSGKSMRDEIIQLRERVDTIYQILIEKS